MSDDPNAGAVADFVSENIAAESGKWKEALRTATPGDAHEIASILNEAIEEGGANMLDSPVSESDLRRKIEASSERELFLVLEIDGSVQGWGEIKRYSDRGGYRFACETAVYVRRRERGRGYGTAIQTGLLDRCAELGYHHVVVKIWASNGESIRLHERLGFETVGRQREIGRIGNKWIDVLIMQRILDPIADSDRPSG